MCISKEIDKVVLVVQAVMLFVCIAEVVRGLRLGDQFVAILFGERDEYWGGCTVVCLGTVHWEHI